MFLDEIEKFWSTSVESYSEININELNTSKYDVWASLLKENIPQKEGLRLLDIGCGPGFFSILTAKMGYKVTAIDYNKDMVDKAKFNSKAFDYKNNIEFLKMDAQNLLFLDNQFDVILSRNLTWNIENPERAYAEWLRVLKPEGKMINFDANWYLYLHDEEKRKEYNEDRKNVAKNGCIEYRPPQTPEDSMIAFIPELPLSSKKRPQWDMDVLKRLGYKNVRCCEELPYGIWDKDEHINYASTPMFMIAAEK